MREVTLPTGEHVPALGLGTWKMGEAPRQQAAEVAAVRMALEMGYRLIDTAEMYGEGGAETVVGQALAEALRAGTVARPDLFIVSKVYPHNASRAGVQAACERSLRRLGLDQLDLYLLHWRGGEPLAETLAGFEALQQRGLIRHWGVSNFDLDDLEELAALHGGAACAANQVYYSLSQRGIEFDVSPWQRRHHMPVMAYSPIDQGALAAQPGLDAIARRLQATPAQVALAWLLAQPCTIAIPKAVREAHLRENLAAADLPLSPDDLAQLDVLFPPPRRKQPLAML
ncbi:aldo/keto reductase [uncultured Aquincola sp.]|uniref:aldo/keto reductase n=1 Tax=uncultured Aquincola sp. TaxID=886556 RepID=UPI0032B21B92